MLGTGPVTAVQRRTGLRIEWRPKALYRLSDDGRRIAIALPAAVSGRRDGNAVTYTGLYPGLVLRYVSQASSLDLQIALDPSAAGLEAALGDALALTWTLDIGEAEAIVGVEASEGEGGDLLILDASGEPALLLMEPLVLEQSAVTPPEAMFTAAYATSAVDGEVEISLVLRGPGLGSSPARDLLLIFAATIALSPQPTTN